MPLIDITQQIIDEAPTFKDLLLAIMEDKRSSIKPTDFYTALEARIKQKCENTASALGSSIHISNLDIQSSPLFFKSLTKINYSNTLLIDTIRCICECLGLNFDGQTISWGD